jgi:hypothetical protein
MTAVTERRKSGSDTSSGFTSVVVLWLEEQA